MRRLLCILLCLLMLIPCADATQEQTLAERIDGYLYANGLDEKNFAFSYFNVDTGEEYQFNEHTFFPAGDIWTLPLHMYYCAKEFEGAFLPQEGEPEYNDPDYEYKIGGMNLDTCRTESILSDNRDVALAMREQIFTEEGLLFQDVVNEAYGHIRAESLPESYYTSDFYSAHFLMNCMKELELTSEIYGDLMRLYDRRPSGNEAFKSSENSLTTKYRTIQIRAQAESMICAVAEVTAPDTYMMVCFVSENAGGDRIMAELNALICAYVEEQSKQGTTDANETVTDDRSERVFEATAKAPGDYSGIGKWFLIALAGTAATAAMLYGLDRLIRYLRRNRRQKKDSSK